MDTVSKSRGLHWESLHDTLRVSVCSDGSKPEPGLNPSIAGSRSPQEALERATYRTRERGVADKFRWPRVALTSRSLRGAMPSGSVSSSDIHSGRHGCVPFRGIYYEGVPDGVAPTPSMVCTQFYAETYNPVELVHKPG